MCPGLLRRKYFRFKQAFESIADLSPHCMGRCQVNQVASLTLWRQLGWVYVLREFECLTRIAEFNSDRNRVQRHISGTELGAEIVTTFPDACRRLACNVEIRTGFRALILARRCHSQHQMKCPVE